VTFPTLAANHMLAECESLYCKAIEQFYALHPRPPWSYARRITRKTSVNPMRASKPNKTLRWKNFVRVKRGPLDEISRTWRAMSEAEKDQYLIVASKKFSEDQESLCHVCSIKPADTPWHVGDKDGPLSLTALDHISPRVNQLHDKWVHQVGGQIGPTAPETQPASASCGAGPA
jgi:hypothetical protein